MASPPSIRRTARIAEIQRKLGLPESDGTQHPPEPALLASPDVEKYAYGTAGHPVTELGFATLDTTDIYPIASTATNFDILSRIKLVHLRTEEAGFLRNCNLRGVDFNQAENFDFGTSEWYRKTQTLRAVNQILCVPDTSNPGENLPVFMVNQGGKGDLTDIGKWAEPAFELEERAGVTHIELTTATAAIRERDAQSNLAYVAGELMHLNTAHLHNAGNDAMVQLMVLVLMAILEHRQHFPNRNDMPLDELYEALSALMKDRPHRPLVGTSIFCTRCGSNYHNRPECNEHMNFNCGRCFAHAAHHIHLCNVGAQFLEDKRQTNYNKMITFNNRRKYPKTIPPLQPLSATELCRADHILEPEVSRAEQARRRAAGAAAQATSVQQQAASASAPRGSSQGQEEAIADDEETMQVTENDIEDMRSRIDSMEVADGPNTKPSVTGDVALATQTPSTSASMIAPSIANNPTADTPSNAVTTNRTAVPSSWATIAARPAPTVRPVARQAPASSAQDTYSNQATRGGSRGRGGQRGGQNKGRRGAYGHGRGRN